MVRIRTHANPYQVPRPETPDWQQVFPREAPILLEVGFGRGDFLLGLARAHPQCNVLGLEIRRALVEHALERKEALGLGHVHAVLADAARHLGELLPPRSVAAAFVLFPDPWRKKKHIKRRVINPALLEVLGTLLQPGGSLEVQTDFFDLATAADLAVQEQPGWISVLGAGDLQGAGIPDCGSRRCRMHRERGAAVYKMRFGLEASPPPPPSDPDPWLGFDAVLPGMDAATSAE